MFNSMGELHPVHQIPIFIREGASAELPNLNKLWEESLEKVENMPKMSELEAGEKWQPAD
ncbi:hypothetical protein [Sedimentisphaera cyanobacteriorum]|uniref:hypothetical protein n=1 Tax=Sedimentisphaera cyanobacteriorum TaxID=1940790 RepID=UPI000F4FB6E1|nr:hypothetical protein [Sedimentisphaera cyanobacteriorum]